MARIVGALHTSFTVANVDRSVEFFRDWLGLQLLGQREIRQPYLDRIVGIPHCVIKAAFFQIPGGHQIELFEYVEPAGQAVTTRPCDPGSVHLALAVDDLTGLHAQLTARGADCVSPPILIEAGPNRGALALYLRDPNGILIELFQPPPGNHA